MQNNIARHGFTLAEILVVVVIMGIAGAIIVPQIGPRGDRDAAAAARILMADLVYAQNLAITGQKNVYIGFDVTGKQYSVMNSTMAVITHPVNKTPYVMKYGTGGTNGLRTVQLVSADFVGSATYAVIGFDELGTPLVYPGATPAQTMTSGSIVLQSGTSKLRVSIEPYTGQISVTPTS